MAKTQEQVEVPADNDGRMVSALRGGLWKLPGFPHFFFRATPMAFGSSQLGVELELQLPATAMPDPSCVFDLRHSLWHCQIFNPLSEASDRTCVLLDTSQGS